MNTTIIIENFSQYINRETPTMKKYFLTFLVLSLFIILLLSIKSIYFSPPYLKVYDAYGAGITKTADPVKTRGMMLLFRVENVRSSPIYVLNISLKPAPPKHIIFNLLNTSFTINPGACVDVWGEFRYLNYSWWRISKITIKYKYLGFIRIDEFDADIFYMCQPVRGELFKRRDNVLQINSVSTFRIDVKVNQTFNITIYLKALEDNIKILDIELFQQNIVLRCYGHPVFRVLNKGDILPVMLDLIAKNKGEEMIRQLEVTYSLGENIYVTYINLVTPIRVKITD